MTKKILILGSEGQIGGHLIEYIKKILIINQLGLIFF